ncbi:MAG: 2-oxo-4-hydroxy-4-carboxy-5-ureidoimidazoline decarboxylase [Proteobacteria bacterium]|nr:2-oxo-4-hydroxy-4-carboxy-5-ureidoimidazoline decarboxylase [Pseudomonadota bacterium]
MTEFKCKPSQMTDAEFIDTFGEVYEHSRWVAEKALEAGISTELDKIENMAVLLAQIVANSDENMRMDLIKSHPDLAGKAAVAGNLTEASTAEQAGAGLESCTAEEFAEFQSFNDAYKEKFGFPYVQAVKNSNRHEILAGFKRRLKNTSEQEFSAALAEIDKIALFRLQDL